MRILILGAGGTGGVFGARLIQAGADVTFAVRPARAEALRRRGLSAALPEGVFRDRVQVRTGAELAPGYEVALLSCKAYDLDDAVETVRRGAGPETVVLPLLNGVAHFGALDRSFGTGRVAGGTCHLACTLEADGSVRQMSPGARIAFGPRPGMPDAARRRLRELAALFARSPVECRHSEDIMQDIWEKFAFIATLASATCLMRAAIGDIVRQPAGPRLVTELFETCAAVARAAGWPMRDASRRDFLGTLLDPASALTSSMLRDLEGGRRTETEHVVGDMLRRAQGARLAPSLLEAAYVHLRARDARLARERAG